ncbi:MAG: GspE/PulE family protein [Candidatus Omnitrophica bacterium]|nr:GspE/PulE family protein [Candidatus Omnitrophota bacterium]
MTIKEKLTKYISNKKGIAEKKIKEISKKAKNYSALKKNIIANKLLSEEEFLLFLSKELRLPFIDLEKYKLSAESKKLVPKEFALKHQVVPLCKIGGALTLASPNLLDLIVQDDLKIIAKAERIDIVLCRQQDTSKALDATFKDTEEIIDTFSQQDKVEEEQQETDRVDLESLVTESNRSPIVRAIDLIVYTALKKRASDIHIEPHQDRLLVKYRIDGILHEEFSFPKKNQDAVIARLKIIASLDITESRVPQDGRFKVKFQDREIDFRVSSLPSHFGEKFVLRALDKGNLSVGLDKLGFSPGPLKLFKKSVEAPFGIILVTGPTGSGKSTTLYSVINQLNYPDKNIVTIEDPVEYQLEGITQIQVNPEIGLTFSEGLRSVLRQSPDIIMVGEIRDSETADIAIKASLTGELIFSTLHTNSAVGAITRLRDMGVERFLLASSLIASTAQRLVRRLCPRCNEEYNLDAKSIKRLGIEDFCRSQNKKGKFYRAKGCPFCNHLGYKGRVGLLEVILLDDKIKEMIINGESEQDIVDYSMQANNFISLKEDGLSKCLDGTTSLEEIIRVASE